MIENIKKVNNPLTIIAIFAALAEVAGTVALGLTDKELQPIFIWFIMVFPTLLVLLYFVTLNFNPKVLYAPSDYENEENFITILSGKKQLSETIDKLNEQLKITQKSLINSSSKKTGKAGFEKLVNEQIELLQNQVQHAKESADNIMEDATKIALPYPMADVIKLLEESPNPMSIYEISRTLNISFYTTKKVLEKLFSKTFICKSRKHDGATWKYCDRKKAGVKPFKLHELQNIDG